ncbi:DMT family transporter [Gordonia sp. NPDC003424]
MSIDSSAIAPSRSALSRSGALWGLVGVAAFSFTIPFTRIAVGGLDPLFIGCGRAVIAAVLAAGALLIGGARVPTPREWLGLVPVALGVVAGFPILTSLALQSTDAGHAAVVVGLLPAATAVAAVTMAGERPSRRFWIGAGCGVLATIGFTVAAHGSIGGIGVADLLLFGAVGLGALGYAQGGLMSRKLGSWQTISWALVLASPIMTALSLWRLDVAPPHATTGQWAAFAYLSAVSMFLGFFAWYRGLAIGPMATISQVQLVQPILSVLWSILLLDEHLTAALVVGGLAVIATAAFTVRSRVVAPPSLVEHTRALSTHAR